MKKHEKRVLFSGIAFVAVDGYIYSVNLFAYMKTAPAYRSLYWILFLSLIAAGVIKLLLTKFRMEKYHKTITVFSMVLSSFIVLFLAMTRDAYAITVAFMLLLLKGILLLTYVKTGS